MTIGIKCKYCQGTGERAACYNNCKDPSGCGDCVDECNFCYGFGILYPKGSVLWPHDVELWGIYGGEKQ